MKTPLYCLPLPFFQVLSNPFHLSCRFQPSTLLLFLLPCFLSCFGWMGDRSTFDLLFYLMILWIYTFRALVHLYQKDVDVFFMQQGVKFTDVWHIIRFFAGTLIWYHTRKHTRAQRHTTHSEASDYTPI